ncbi:MAG: M56 family metallopeptidase [Acidobacteriota bacterium]
MTGTFAHAVPGWIVGSLVYLAVGGLLVRLALAVALRVAHPRWIRGRYWLAVAAFVAAVVVPLIAYGQAIERALDDPLPLLRTHAVPGVAVDLGPEEARRAWLQFFVTSWPARDAVRLWLLGVALLATRGAVAALRLALLRRRWRPASPNLLRRLEWPQHRELRVSETGVPLATGVLRPAVFLPLWLFDALDPDAVRSVARHELAHLRSRDPLVDLGVRAVRAALWPSLGLWSIARVIDREREVACDREALTSGRPAAALAYAETLAAVAARRVGRLSPALGAARPGELEARVARLLTPPSRRGPLRLAAAVAAVALGALGILGVPFPGWLDAPTDETAIWGPLDHLLGYNPAIHAEHTADGPLVIIQGQTLDDEAAARWFHSERTLSELAATVLAVEAEARAAPAGP